jgi:uncharacterized membrane protein
VRDMDDTVERTVGTRALEREESHQPPTSQDPWAGGATREIERLGLAGAEPHREGAGDELQAVPAVAQIGGHPLHPAVVPLPIGALTLAAVSDLAYVATKDRFWARSSQALIAAGLATGAVAAVLGATDFVGRERTRRHGEAWLHAGGNLAVMGLSALNLALRRGRSARAIMPAGMLLSGISGLLLGVTGWLGGELSYRYRIGVTRE